jgi:hypothetical protein
MENPRTDSARAHDDSDLIEQMTEAPSFSGSAGGNLQRDIGTRAEVEHETLDETSVTRVRASDKQPEANLPRFNER